MGTLWEWEGTKELKLGHGEGCNRTAIQNTIFLVLSEPYFNGYKTNTGNITDFPGKTPITLL
jgi:hypothetical protein